MPKRCIKVTSVKIRIADEETYISITFTTKIEEMDTNSYLQKL
jgi:hypothetical protein